jgi:hypothetical protein
LADRSGFARPPRTSEEALAQAEHEAIKTRLDGIDRATAADREAQRRIGELRARMGRPAMSPPEAWPETISDGERGANQQRWNEYTPEEQAIAREMYEIEQECWEVYRDVEAERDEQDRSAALPWGDAAMERLRALRAELAQLFVARMPTPAEYKAFLCDVFAPAYNEISPHDRYCIECGTRFALADRRSRKSEFCSNDCRSRKGNRGRPRVSKADKVRREILQHYKGCAACKAGTSCGQAASILAQEQTLAARSRALREGDEPAARLTKKDGVWRK